MRGTIFIILAIITFRENQFEHTMVWSFFNFATKFLNTILYNLKIKGI
jgi:hypothetical protein